MFQSARVNQPIYILYKEAVPRLEIGSITQVTQPMVKFPTIPQYGQPQEHVVDVHANVGGADFGAGNVFVSINRDAMNAEIENLKKASEEHLRRVDEERQKIVKYDEILMQLNPEFAEKQRQEQEIATLKNQVAQLAQTNSNLESMMARLMDKLDGDGSKSTKTK